MKKIRCEICGYRNASFDLICAACEKPLPLNSSATHSAEPETGAAQGFPETGEPFPLPHQLERFELVSLLGKGGSGYVYKARDSRLDRWVAIKVLNPAMLEAGTSLKRLLREARAASRLNHPNIVVTYDLSVDEETPYIAMEWVAGASLDRILAERKLEPRIAAGYALQICDGLAAAHHQGVIHRDMKPANIMVTRQNAVKILDFGLAKLKRSETGAWTLTTTTGPGLFRGTPAYMAPEQIMCKPVDQRCDIFSSAMSIYEMLAGHHPFTAENQAVVMHRICHVQPNFEDDIFQMAPNLRVALAKALAKDPAERFANMESFASAFREFGRV